MRCRSDQKRALMHALEIEQLTVSFDKTPVLWDINFSLPTGRLCAVVGPNGAGKSTLLQAILGIVKPLSGTIRLLGEEARKVQARVDRKSTRLNSSHSQ